MDVGAHNGSILAAAVEAAPQLQHHAFEPGPAAASLQQRFPSVVVHQCCVGSVQGQVEFHEYQRSTRSSTNLVPGEDVTRTSLVKQVTLDGGLPEGVHPAVIKIDVEGSELEVLEGATGVVLQYRPHIVFEHGAPGGAIPDTTNPLFDLLQDLGYRCAVLRGGLLETRQQFAYTVRSGEAWNFLAVPSSTS